MGIKKLR